NPTRQLARRVSLGRDVRSGALVAGGAAAEVDAVVPGPQGAVDVAGLVVADAPHRAVGEQGGRTVQVWPAHDVPHVVLEVRLAGHGHGVRVLEEVKGRAMVLEWLVREPAVVVVA